MSRFTLAQAPVETLVTFLKKEQTQVAALVIANLPRAKAAEVLQVFSPREQAELARRIIDLRETDPSIIQAVEDELAAIMAESMEAHLRRVSGQSILQEILSSTVGAARESLVENLTQEGVSLTPAKYAFKSEELAGDLSFTPLNGASTTETTTASSLASNQEGMSFSGDEGLRRPPRAMQDQSEPEKPAVEMPEFVFNDLAKLDKQSLYRVLGESPELSMLALAGASPRLIAQISRGLTSREASVLRRRMEQLGPMRLRDVEQAQIEIARLVAQLAQRGEIKLPRNRRFAGAA